MSNKADGVGKIEWIDLTVSDADHVRDFYRDVVGWQPKAVSMGNYDDWSMLNPETGVPAVGICHARGANSAMPAHWLIYIKVADLDDSIKKCLNGGGKVIDGPRTLGEECRFCIIEDPAGAVAALYGHV
jgi:uncharacterized protein